MYMLIQKTKFAEGAYAVVNKNHEKVLFFFEEEDDAWGALGVPNICVQCNLCV